MRTINVLLVSLLLSRFSTTDANGHVMSAAEMVKVQNSVEAVKVAASGTEVGADTSTTWNDVSTAYTAKATGNLAAKSLQEMAQTTWAEASWAKTAKDFYAADGRMSTDQFATAVIAGDGAFGKDTYNPGRIEAIKKATHDEIQINYVLGAAQHAVSTSDTADWEAAAALYFGALLADVDAARLATTSGYHPSTVANKRCANFGTCPWDTTTKVRPAAPQNTAIKAAFDGGVSAENYEKIADQIALTYSYASMRYLWKLDDDLQHCDTSGKGEEDHHYEGLAFFRVLQPHLAASDAAGAAAIAAIYDEKRDDQMTMSNGGTFYCPSKDTLHTFMGTLGFAACAGTATTDCVGTFEEDGSQDCSSLPATRECARTGEVAAKEYVKIQTHVQAVKEAAAATETTGAWTDVAAAYAAQGDAAMSLQDMAQHVFTEDGWAKTSQDFYAADGKMSTDEFATAVIAGTGAFGKATYNPGRVEGIKKATHDQIQINYVLGLAQRAVATSSVDDWASAAALYFGAVLDDVDAARLATTSGYHPSTVANKRCANFGTCPVGGTASPQNIAIKDAFMGGMSAANYKAIEDQIALTYSYASMRYLWKLDNDLKDCDPSDSGYQDHHFEGLAFFRTLEPQLAAVNAAGAAAIAEFYHEDRDDMTTQTVLGTVYCPAKTTLHSAMETRGLAACDGGTHHCVGTFEEDASQDCDALATATTCARSILAVQDNVKAVKEAAAATDSDGAWSAVLPAYTNGPYALLSLEGMAQHEFAEAGWAKTSFDYWANPLTFGLSTDQFAKAVIAGTSPFSQAGYNPGRIEAIKKATHDQIQINFVLGLAKRAVATGSAEDWAAAAALYFGQLLEDVDVDTYSTSGYHPSTVANKRCANFGTCPADAGGVRPVSPQNVAIKAAFVAGRSAANYDKIEDQIALTYSYATMRYLWKLDDDLSVCTEADLESKAYQDHHWEGLSFYRTLEPQFSQWCVTEASNDFAFAAIGIAGVYAAELAIDDDITKQMTVLGEFFCPAKEALHEFMASRCTTSCPVGEFEKDTASDDLCPVKTTPSTACLRNPNYVAPSDDDATTEAPTTVSSSGNTMAVATFLSLVVGLVSFSMIL